MPAYNAAETLKETYEDIDFSIVDDVVLVDDCSTDKTVLTAEKLGIKHIIKHDVNKGYGGNQKTCYDKAISLEADIVIMLHPDYQYTPKLIPSMVSIIANGVYPVVFGSRILGKGALKGGMPIYKYIAIHMRYLICKSNYLIYQISSRLYVCAKRNVDLQRTCEKSGVVFQQKDAPVTSLFSRKWDLGAAIQITKPSNRYIILICTPSSDHGSHLY